MTHASSSTLEWLKVTHPFAAQPGPRRLSAEPAARQMPPRHWSTTAASRIFASSSPPPAPS